MKTLIHTSVLNLLLSASSIMAQTPTGPTPQKPPSSTPLPLPPTATSPAQSTPRLLPPGLPGLTEEQRKKVFEYNQEIAKARSNHEENLNAAKKALAAVIFSETNNPEIIRAKVADISKIEAEIHIARASAFTRLRPHLSQEQIESMRNNFDDGSRQRIQGLANMPFPKADQVPGTLRPTPPSGLPKGGSPGLVVPPPPGVVAPPK